MSSYNKSRLFSAVLHFDIKDHMKFDKLVVAGDRLIVIKNFKCNFDICHLFSDGIVPKCVTVCFINHHRLLHSFGNIDSIILVAFQIERPCLFDEIDNAHMIFQDKRNPQVKCRFTFKNLGHSIFNRIKCMRLLKVQ